MESHKTEAVSSPQTHTSPTKPLLPNGADATCMCTFSKADQQMSPSRTSRWVQLLQLLGLVALLVSKSSAQGQAALNSGSSTSGAPALTAVDVASLLNAVVQVPG